MLRTGFFWRKIGKNDGSSEHHNEPLGQASQDELCYMDSVDELISKRMILKLILQIVE
jgi:hypothetical protein